ncbi:MAG: sulfatase [Verrucomicrobia bacterium]|nr:sulfatase [Verrucomicrobiota bacterium]
MRFLLIPVLLPFIVLTGCADQKQIGQQPNIVFILSDDVGWADLNVYDPLERGYYETPNLNQLASQSMRFTDAYASASCSPTRAALMSGQYYPHQPVYDVGPVAPGLMIPAPNTDDLPPEKITLAEALKTGGYETGFIGKWHIGNAPINGPSEQGFDLNIGGYSALSPRWSGGYFEPNNNKFIDDAEEGEYLTNYLTRKAVTFIEEHQEDPFYLHLSYYSVHVPLQAPEDRIEKFRQKQGTGGHDNPTYAAMLESLDDGVGQIMETLERLNLDDNTILVFYSDNGGFGGYSSVGVTDPKMDITDNAPLRNGKLSFYEGGIRVPLMVRWPGVVTPGTQCNEPVIHVDMYPTLLEAVQLDRPDGYLLDGVSIMPLLKDPEANLNREALYWHFPGYTQKGFEGGPQSVIRSGPWKLIKRYEDNSLELYNLEEDIGETKNMVDTQPAIRTRLKNKLEEWLNEVDAPMPKHKDT